MSSVPRTPDSRLRSPPTTPDSVLYLAYGSNLCAETLLGVRGIRPISRVGISAPSLDLTFDLPGIPYLEPCFANTAPRKIPKPPKVPKPPGVPSIDPPKVQARDENNRGENDAIYERAEGRAEDGRSSGSWTKGLIGVVFEVTHEDYATIVATEGGGSSYADILVPCLPLPPRLAVPEKPPIDLPKPFLAHTLYAAAIPNNLPRHPSSTDRDDYDGARAQEESRSNDDNGHKKWYRHLVGRPHRDDPSYAQPSARYLKLITDGARENELPEDYQRYLADLQPYTVTTWRQKIGRVIMMLFLVPLLLLNLVLSKILAGRNGRVPTWMAVLFAAAMNLLWIGYDRIMKPLFGDGERTQDEDEDADVREGFGTTAPRRLTKRWWRERCCSDEEKQSLLLDDDL